MLHHLLELQKGLTPGDLPHDTDLIVSGRFETGLGFWSSPGFENDALWTTSQLLDGLILLPQPLQGGISWTLSWLLLAAYSTVPYRSLPCLPRYKSTAYVRAEMSR